MANLTTVSLALALALAFGMLALASLASAHDPSDVQCADETARSLIASLGGRSRIMTLLMNFVKCLQRSHNELYKLSNDVLADMVTCTNNKPDVFDVIKCMSQDAAAKRISALVARTADVFKCAME